MSGREGAQAVTWDDIESAAERLEGIAHRTPVMTSRTFDERTGTRAFFKCCLLYTSDAADE